MARAAAATEEASLQGSAVPKKARAFCGANANVRESGV